MKFHEALIELFDGCILTDDRFSVLSAVAYINLAMKADDLKPKHARLVRGKIVDVVEWLKEFNADDSIISDCIKAVEPWLEQEIPDEEPGQQTETTGDEPMIDLGAKPSESAEAEQTSCGCPGHGD
ncbi:hypothetical protein ACFL14_00410 [Patescibacteria group bacterium]